MALIHRMAFGAVEAQHFIDELLLLVWCVAKIRRVRRIVNHEELRELAEVDAGNSVKNSNDFGDDLLYLHIVLRLSVLR